MRLWSMGGLRSAFIEIGASEREQLEFLKSIREGLGQLVAVQDTYSTFKIRSSSAEANKYYSKKTLLQTLLEQSEPKPDNKAYRAAFFEHINRKDP